MPNNQYDILKTAFSRVFLIEGKAAPDHVPAYMSSLKLTALTQNFGDTTKIEVPDEDNYGKFIEVDNIRGMTERATTTLVGRYAANLKSTLLRLARQGCEVDVQLHVGKCTDPSSFNTFSKGLILERVSLTTWSSEDLGALESGENAKVNETANVSAVDVYEVVPMTFASRANDVVTNPVMDVKVIDSVSCAECAVESDGCNDIFCISKAAGGSPSTPADILFSLDGGATFSAHDVDGMNVASDGSSVFPVGDQIVAISKDEAALFYAPKADFVAGVDPAFTKVTTGFVQNPWYGCAAGRKAFIVGNWGYVYLCEDPAAGVTVLDAGSATTSTLKSVHAMDQYNAIACGNDGTVLYTFDQVTWVRTTTSPVGIGTHLTGCHMVSKTTFWVAASNGKLYYTKDSGATWHMKAMPGTAPSAMLDVHFATKSVGFASGTVSSKGRMFRTFDGGNSWVVLPENGAAFTPATEVTKIAACKFDPNFVVGVGQNYPTNTDGIIIVGNGA